MPNIDTRKYRDTRFFQYTVRRTLTASQRDTGGFTRIQNDSDFIVHKIVGTSTGAFDMQIQETGTGRQFFDGEIRQGGTAATNVIIGTAQRPNILMQPKLIYANSTLNWTFVDQSAAANTIEVVLEGLKGFKSLPGTYQARSVLDLTRYVEQDYFAYRFITATALSANASTVLNVSIQADSDFLLQKITGRQTGTYRIRITDQACGMILSDELVDNANLVGTAQQPMVLLKPQLILANTVLTANITDTSGASNTIEVALEGTKLFLGR